MVVNASAVADNVRQWMANWRRSGPRDNMPSALAPLSRVDPTVAVEIAFREITRRRGSGRTIDVADLAWAIGRSLERYDGVYDVRQANFVGGGSGSLPSLHFKVGMVLLTAISTPCCDASAIRCV
jgi:hypothetical protein